MSNGAGITTGGLPARGKEESIHDYERRMLKEMYAKGVAAADAAYESAVGRANAAYHRIASDAEKAKNSEMEYAGVLYERMKKYLPLQQKQAGMGNMGISQTGLNQLTTSHMNRRSDIQGKYNDAISDANYALGSAISLADQTRSTAINNLDSTNAQELMKIYMAEDEAKKEQRQAEIDSFMNNLNVYSDAEAALNAFGAKFGTDSEEYSTYQAEIEGYFVNKATTDFDKAYEDLFNYPDSASAQAFIDSLDKTSWTEEQKAKFDSGVQLLDYKSPEEIKQGQEASLAAYNSQLAIMMQANPGDTDAMYALLDSFNDRISEDAYNTSKAELDAYKSDPQRQLETKQNEMSQNEYVKELELLDDASKAGYNDVEAYVANVLSGEEDIIVSGESGEEKYTITSDKPLNNHFLNRSVFADALKEQTRFNSPFDSNIPNGTVVETKDTGKGFRFDDLGIPDVSNPWNLIPGFAEYNWIAEMGVLPKISNKKDVYIYFNGAWYPAKKAK